MKKVKLSVFGANLQDQSRGTFEVHAHDCHSAHYLRKLREHESVAEYNSALDMSADVWSDMIREGSMTAEQGLSEFHICNCVHWPPAAVTADMLLPHINNKRVKIEVGDVFGKFYCAFDGVSLNPVHRDGKIVPDMFAVNGAGPFGLVLFNVNDVDEIMTYTHKGEPLLIIVMGQVGV